MLSPVLRHRLRCTFADASTVVTRLPLFAGIIVPALRADKSGLPRFRLAQVKEQQRKIEDAFKQRQDKIEERLKKVRCLDA
jgi:hypothetical protein